MSWGQQQSQRLPRILTDAESASEEKSKISSRQQMGPPSQSLPSLNFRQLAPLRSPNLPSSTPHSSSYFNQQRHRSTSESIANDALRSLRHGLPPPPNLPEPPHSSSVLVSSSSPTFPKRGEVLPSLAAFGSSPTSISGSLFGEERGGGEQHSLGKSSKIPASTSSSSSSPSSSHYYHPYQQQQQQQHHQPAPHHYHHQSNPNILSLYRSPSAMHVTPSPHAGSNTYSGLPSSGMPTSSTSSQDIRFFSPSSPSNAFDHSMNRSRGSSTTLDRDDPNSPRKLAKSHVPSACLNCKRAHLACDVSRPCRRCINLGKMDTCIDVQHKKRGRPRLRDREAAAAAAAAAAAVVTAGGAPVNIGLFDHRIPSGLPGQRLRGSFSSTSTTSTMRQSPRSEPTTYFPGESKLMNSPTRASNSNMPLMNQRGRSISSSTSQWSQTTPSGGVSASASGDFSSSDTSSPTVSLILSTGLQCARCSVESHALLGYSPSDLIEKSLFELVHPNETHRLEQLWLNLIEPVRIKSQVVPANAETVMTLSPAILMAPAPGTVYMQETMRLRQRSGIYDFYSIRLHLGGGFGADLYQSSTLDRAYIVASLLKLGNDATHPDPNILHEAKWYLGNDPRHFTTPQSSKTIASPTRAASNNNNTISSVGMGGFGAGPVDSDSAGNFYSSPSAVPSATVPSRYEWQQSDNDSRSVPAPLTHPPPPPPYSKSAYQNANVSSSYDSDRTSSFTLRKADQHSTTTKSTTTSIPFSYSSGGERGSILC